MALLAKVLVASMLVLLGCQLASSASVATVSIDIGSEFIKIGLVKPGVPMDIVLNRESKRKTPNVLAIRKGEREFGSDALHTYVKYPQNAYRFLTELLGQKIDSPIVKRYQRLFPEHKLEEDTGRGTVIFRIDEETTYSVEELVAMILEHVMELASEYAEVPVSSAVITVPPYFTQASRKSLLMAAKLGGVNVIQLLSTPAAVGLNYGVFRRSEFNETEQLFMFVDVGSTATTATVAGFKVVKEKDTKTKNPQLELRGMAYDRSLGGLEFDMRMRDILLEKFLNGAKKPKGDIRQNHRALAKLLTGAQKAKTVLSANIDTIAQVEGLFEEINLKETVTREEYETACADLFERVKAPVLAALKAADVSADQLHQLIIIGGGVRVPKIQTILKDLVGGRELGKNLNGDEAAALGAAYQAAANTKSFRVKKFLVKDINPFPIDVVFERETEGEDGVKETRTITRTIFPRGNAVPQKKLLKFNFETDFNFRMNYGDLSFLSEEQVKELGALNISTVDMSGVQKAYEDHKDIPNEGVKAHFRIDESGVVSIARAEVVFEKPAEPASILDNIADSIGSLFGKGDGDKKAAGEDAAKAEGSDKGDEAEGDGEDAKKASEEEEEKPASEEGKGSSDDAKPEDAGKGSSESGSEDAKADADDAKTEGSDSGSDEDEEEADEGEKKAATDSEEGEKKPEGETKAGEGAGDSEGEGAEKKAEGDSGKEESTSEGGAKSADDEKKEGAAKDEKKAAKDEKKKPPKPTTIKVPLSLKVKTLDVADLTEAGEKESKARMADFRKKEITKRETAKAKNNLETFIYAMQDKLSNADVEAASTEEERSTLREQLSAASDWLYEDGMDVGAADYIARADELNSTAKEIMFRVKEHKDRPEAVSRLEQSLKMSFEFVEKVKTMNANLTEGENPWITETEMESLLTVANETSTWLAEKKAKQAETPLTETPVLKTSAIAQKAAKLDRELLSLIKKPKPKPKPTPKPKAEKVVVNGTETDDGAKAEEGSEKPSTTTEEGKPEAPEAPEAKTTEETAKGGADDAGDSAKKTEGAGKDEEATGKTEETPAKEEPKKKAEKKTENKKSEKSEKTEKKSEKKSEKAEKKTDKKEKAEKKTEKKAEKEESKKGRRSSKSRKDDKEEL